MWRAALALLATLLICTSALADADPASDVLLTANAFYPYSPPPSAKLAATLDAELSAAHKLGFPIKVAEIATAIDLGAIPQLYDKPQQYAAFLDQEISFAGKVPVLVLMPDGYGSAGLSRSVAAVVASFPAPSTRTGNGLTEAAISAVRRLASAAGHPLGRVSARTSAGGGGVVLPLAVLLAVCAALATGILTVRRRRARATAVRRR